MLVWLLRGYFGYFVDYYSLQPSMHPCAENTYIMHLLCSMQLKISQHISVYHKQQIADKLFHDVCFSGLKLEVAMSKLHLACFNLKIDKGMQNFKMLWWPQGCKNIGACKKQMTAVTFWRHQCVQHACKWWWIRVNLSLEYVGNEDAGSDAFSDVYPNILAAAPQNILKNNLLLYMTLS